MTLDIHFGYDEEGNAVSIPLFQTFFDATTGHGKTVGMKTLLWRFHKVHPDWRILVIDSKDKRDYADLNSDISICFVETTEPLDLKNLLEPLVGSSMMYYFDQIIEEAIFDSLSEMQENINQKIEAAVEGKVKIHSKALGKLRVLNHLLKKLVKLVDRPEITSELELHPGFNVMPVSLPGVPGRLKKAFQWLIVRSVMLKLTEPEYEKVLVVLDEFHKWSPQRWASICKQQISENVAEGRGKLVFYWMADQALAKVDKEPLKPVKVWIVGQQLGRHEVKYAMETVNDMTELTVDKKDIKRLAVGFFVVVDGLRHTVTKAYLQPYGVSDELAVDIATGKRDPREVEPLIHSFSFDVKKESDEDLVYKEKCEKLELELKEKKEELEQVVDMNKTMLELEKKVKTFGEENERLRFEVKDLEQHKKLGEDAKNLQQALRRFLQMDKLQPLQVQGPPGARKVDLKNVKTVVDVKDVIQEVEIKTDTVAGKILTVAKKGKLSVWSRLGDVVNAITEEGWTVTSQATNMALRDLVKQDLIAKKHTDRNYFRLAKNVKFREVTI